MEVPTFVIAAGSKNVVVPAGKAQGEVVQIEDQVGSTKKGYQQEQEALNNQFASGNDLLAHNVPRDERWSKVDQEESAYASEDRDDHSDARQHDGDDYTQDEEQHVVYDLLHQVLVGTAQVEDVGRRVPPDHADEGVNCG